MGEYPRGTFRFKKLCGSLWKGETLRFADYTYEIRYMATDNQNCYQSEPIPILYSKDEHESSKTQVTQIKQYSIHGGIQGTIKDNFPEVARELDD